MSQKKKVRGAVKTNLQTQKSNTFVLGVSEKYENQSNPSRNQTYAQLGGVEGGTGAAYSDESGITVSLTARQFEMPRQYVTGTIAVAAGGLTATTT